MLRQRHRLGASGSLTKNLLIAGIVAFIPFAIAIGLGVMMHGWGPTLSLMGTSIVLESQPAAVASIALGFSPWVGGVVSLMSNLIAIPFLIVLYPWILHHWRWARKKVRRTERWMRRHMRYGVFMLTPVAPFFGAYVSITVGYGLGWRLRSVVLATLTGTILSVALIVFGGQFVVRLFIH